MGQWAERIGWPVVWLPPTALWLGGRRRTDCFDGSTRPLRQAYRSAMRGCAPLPEGTFRISRCRSRDGPAAFLSIAGHSPRREQKRSIHPLQFGRSTSGGTNKQPLKPGHRPSGSEFEPQPFVAFTPTGRGPDVCRFLGSDFDGAGSVSEAGVGLTARPAVCGSML